ncbi:MAG: ATP-binding cassette domain-containing protein [Firmicutes bacterium]|nr:ATP-binding cassette domain-containing protein [Bacillota bacterium]
MTILVFAHDLSMSFTTEPLFKGLNFRVETGARIGLVGPNGCGKTTLFRLINAQLEPTAGKISLARETVAGYMEQQPDNLALPLRSAVREVFSPLINIEEELAGLNHRLDKESSPELLARQHNLQEKYAASGGYTYESRLNAALMGLGFAKQELELPLSSLSGGQRSKALLARALLKEANLLLLDEPTNHLDIAALEWLEGYLAAWRGAFIIISHDRYFLDKLTTITWELADGRLYKYNGNYSAHLALKATRENSLTHRQEQARREARRIEAMIEQQKSFNRERNYRTIASKQKQLARIETEVQALSPLAAARRLSFSFVTPPPGGQEVLRVYDLSKSFDKRRLFEKVDMAINKSERVFLLGPNGCGKTTLLKMILGRLGMDNGHIKLGVNIVPAYFDQMTGTFDSNRTILEELTERFPRLTQHEIRSALGRFLFFGEDVYKPAAQLSGGEKARLTLLTLLLTPANFLLLDEPSNHLDIFSREAVEQALLDYSGAMLVVSHDRYLINKLAQRIYVLEQNGIKQYLGNYDDYLEKMMKDNAILQEKDLIQSGEEKPGRGAIEYRQRKEEQSRRRKAERRVLLAEKEIQKAEKELARLNAALTAAATDYLRLPELAKEHEQAEDALMRCYEEWEAAQIETH